MKVFVDTNILKLSVFARRVYWPKSAKTKWGDIEQETTFYASGYHYPLDAISNKKMRIDAHALLVLAEASKIGRISFIQTNELNLEAMGLPKTDSVTGRLFGEKIHRGKHPIEYERVVFGPGQSWRDRQYEFLCLINHPRFQELQKATGAYQGHLKKPNRNQLLDAFHLWSAEENGCKYFLTVDYKLIKVVSQCMRRLRPIDFAGSPALTERRVSL